MGLIQKEYQALGVESSELDAFLAAVPFNVFSILTARLVPLVALTGRDFGAMRAAEARTESGDLYWPHSRPLRPVVSEAPEAAGAAFVWVPLVALFVVLFGILAPEGFPFTQVPGGTFRTALSSAYFLAAVCLIALMVRAGARSFDEAFGIYMDGIGRMAPVAMILLLAWSLGALGRELGTAEYVTAIAQARVPAIVVPALVFLVGAVLSGGLFGDHASPISDTTVLSSTGAGSDHIDHVRTQLPYALACAGASLVAFLAAAMLSKRKEGQARFSTRNADGVPKALLYS